MDIAAAIAKQRYDRQHRQIEFKAGEEVWLTLGKYKLKGKQNAKTMPRREGPYKITKKISPLAYELKLPNKSGIHPTISI
jgi:hypothetical protein